MLGYEVQQAKSEFVWLTGIAEEFDPKKPDRWRTKQTSCCVLWKRLTQCPECLDEQHYCGLGMEGEHELGWSQSELWQPMIGC